MNEDSNNTVILELIDLLKEQKQTYDTWLQNRCDDKAADIAQDAQTKTNGHISRYKIEEGTVDNIKRTLGLKVFPKVAESRSGITSSEKLRPVSKGPYTPETHESNEVRDLRKRIQNEQNDMKYR